MWMSSAKVLLGRSTRFRVLQASRICFSTIPLQRQEACRYNLCYMELGTQSKTGTGKWVGKRVTSNDTGSENSIHGISPMGQKLSRNEKNSLLVKTLSDLGDSKDAIYGALDAWVSWEKNFPIAALKNVLITLEKEQQWHRVVQVIKWMLSKGQGNTMGTYQQLIRALDMDHRAEEAHRFWMKKIGNDLHSVPWQTCHLMISIYYRNNMLDCLVKLFKGLEAFDRKPPDRLIVQKVADTYEKLGMVNDKERLLEKYAAVINKTSKDCDKRSSRVASRRKVTLSGSKSSLADASVT